MAENNRVVDARGRSCPEPVLMTKKALAQQSGRLQVLVDNQVAVDNITRFAQNKGLAVRVENKGSDFQLTIG
ncbi:MAG TPA: sulfurtransferase TusA family protein [Firmicutes bacterium]|nr:sulfurtransferase TusA family protein [Bacillota bacterium]